MLLLYKLSFLVGIFSVFVEISKTLDPGELLFLKNSSIQGLGHYASYNDINHQQQQNINAKMIIWEKENINFNIKNKNNSSFQVIHEWKYLDYEYSTYVRRQQAIASRKFIIENNLPLGIDIYKKRIFITTPRWKDGVPASLSYLPYPNQERSPALRPYPDWESHGDPYNPECTKLISVYRTSIDECGRLWLIDSGIVNATVNLNQICPPKIVAFDLATDQLIVNYELPFDQVKQDSLHSNILVDIAGGLCNDAHIYVADVWRFGLIVYSLSKNRSWRITNYQFSPNPKASDFNVYGLNFQWLDGIFGMSLSVEQQHKERVLYFHPMASFKEFMVSTNLLRDESLWPVFGQNVSKNFQEIGDRGCNGQSSSAAIDRNGIMFYTQVHRDAVGCWNTALPYIRANLDLLVDNSTQLIQFPNDLKVDQELNQGVWVMSNRLPIYLYDKLDYADINFRILRADVKKAVRGTMCDPNSKTFSQRLQMQQISEESCF